MTVKLRAVPHVHGGCVGRLNAGECGRLASRLVELIAGFLAVGIVIAIAAFFVAREAGRIAKDPPPALFDFDDAYAWVVDHLPDDIADAPPMTCAGSSSSRSSSSSARVSRRTAPPRIPRERGDRWQRDRRVHPRAVRGHAGEAYLAEQVYGVIETQAQLPPRDRCRAGPPVKADPDDPKTHGLIPMRA